MEQSCRALIQRIQWAHVLVHRHSHAERDKLCSRQNKDWKEKKNRESRSTHTGIGHGTLEGCTPPVVAVPPSASAAIVCCSVALLQQSGDGAKISSFAMTGPSAHRIIVLYSGRGGVVTSLGDHTSYQWWVVVLGSMYSKTR